MLEPKQGRRVCSLAWTALGALPLMIAALGNKPLRQSVKNVAVWLHTRRDRCRVEFPEHFDGPRLEKPAELIDCWHRRQCLVGDYLLLNPANQQQLRTLLAALAEPLASPRLVPPADR